MKYLFILFLVISCKVDPPCSVLDSTCNPLAYFIPDLIKPKPVGGATGTGPATIGGTITGLISNGLILNYNNNQRLTPININATSYSFTSIPSGAYTISIAGNTGELPCLFGNNTTTQAGNTTDTNSNAINITCAFPSPKSLTGLALWLRADILTLADNAAVASWPDDSGNGYDVTQGNANNRPTFKTNILNAKPVIRFDGAANPNHDFLIRTGSNPNMTTGGTFYNQTDFFVLRRNAIGATHYVFTLSDDGAGAGTNQFFFLNNITPNDFSHGSSGVLTVTTIFNANNITNHFIYSFRGENPSSGNYKGFLYRNGENAGTYLNATMNYKSDTQIIIGRVSNGVTDPFNGDMAEIIHYNRLLTRSEHDKIVCFLAQKYNITTVDVTCVR